MKRILFVFGLIMFFSTACFSQELIGRRLKYEIREPGTGNSGNCYISITDVYQDNWVYSFYLRMNVANIHDIYDNRRGNETGTADLYSDDFPAIISQYIVTTSQQGGHSEWRQYADIIAIKITQYVQSFHRRQ